MIYIPTTTFRHITLAKQRAVVVIGQWFPGDDVFLSFQLFILFYFFFASLMNGDVKVEDQSVG
jgi:hypothetical protein